MALFVEHLNIVAVDITDVLKSKLQYWMTLQAAFIQVLFANLSWES